VKKYRLEEVLIMSLTFGLYPGCIILTEQYAYEIAARNVLPLLDVKLVDLNDISCCGEPLMSMNKLTWLYLAARNIAIAEKSNVDIMCLCNACYLSLNKAKKLLMENLNLLEKINLILNDEGLKYTGKPKVKHLIEILHDDVGINKIREKIRFKLVGLKLASYTGCHLLRPSSIIKADDPENPSKLNRLVEALGALSPRYPEELECCGAGLLIPKPDGGLSYASTQLKAIVNRGFDGVVTVCPACHKMFDSKQAVINQTLGLNIELPVIYYIQILGLAMGLSMMDIGLHLNQSPCDKLVAKVKGNG